MPSLFRNDDLNVLGPDMRPSYRWLLIGSSGSGTPFHVDPFGTSAWNYCVKGKKLWIMQLKIGFQKVPQQIGILRIGTRLMEKETLTEIPIRVQVFDSKVSYPLGILFL